MSSPARLDRGRLRQDWAALDLELERTEHVGEHPDTAF